MKKKIETNFYSKSHYWPRRMKKIKNIVKDILIYDDFGFKFKKYYFINLIFTNDMNIKKLNNDYRKKNQTTDVLTFTKLINNHKKINEVFCDIFFSAETIKNDAKKNSISFYDHLTHLIVHCFLHINGYDHKKKSEYIIMKSLEKKILSKLGINNPYQI